MSACATNPPTLPHIINLFHVTATVLLVPEMVMNPTINREAYITATWNNCI
jgi:hypothetical protein